MANETDADVKDALNEYQARCDECGGRIRSTGTIWDRAEQCEDCGKWFKPEPPGDEWADATLEDE